MGERSDFDLCSQCGNQFPAGQVCSQCGAQGVPVPDLEELLRRSQGIVPEHDKAIEIMTAIHARWRKAWEDTGAFSSEEAFELVRILVATSAGGIRALGLSLPQQRRRRSRTQGNNLVRGCCPCPRPVPMR